MAQMWLLWWPKVASSTTGTRNGGGTTRARSTATSGLGGTAETGSNSINYCCRLAKFTEKLKKRKRRAVQMLRGQWRPTSSSSKQSSLQCRYDPLSYSLNFDERGSGIPVADEEDYYQFYAFSSRFAANPTCSSSSSSSCPSCSSLHKQQD